MESCIIHFLYLITYNCNNPRKCIKSRNIFQTSHSTFSLLLIISVIYVLGNVNFLILYFFITLTILRNIFYKCISLFSLFDLYWVESCGHQNEFIVKAILYVSFLVTSRSSKWVYCSKPLSLPQLLFKQWI